VPRLCLREPFHNLFGAVCAFRTGDGGRREVRFWSRLGIRGYLWEMFNLPCDLCEKLAEIDPNQAHRKFMQLATSLNFSPVGGHNDNDSDMEIWLQRRCTPP